MSTRPLEWTIDETTGALTLHGLPLELGLQVAYDPLLYGWRWEVSGQKSAPFSRRSSAAYAGIGDIGSVIRESLRQGIRKIVWKGQIPGGLEICGVVQQYLTAVAAPLQELLQELDELVIPEDEPGEVQRGHG